MKSLLLLLLLSVSTYSMNDNKPLYDTFREKQKAKKHNLLTQQVAYVWGHKGRETRTAEEYLQKVADYVLQDYDLSLQQKVKSIKARHILRILEKAISHREHRLRAAKLDIAYPINEFTRNERYQFEKKIVNATVLRGVEIATDLLIQSFSPLSLHSENYNHYDREKKNSGLHTRLAGAFILINELVDQKQQVPFNFDYIFENRPRKILSFLQRNVLKTFGKAAPSKPGTFKPLYPIGTDVYTIGPKPLPVHIAFTDDANKRPAAILTPFHPIGTDVYTIKPKPLPVSITFPSDATKRPAGILTPFHPIGTEVYTIRPKPIQVPNTVPGDATKRPPGILAPFHPIGTDVYTIGPNSLQEPITVSDDATKRPPGALKPFHTIGAYVHTIEPKPLQEPIAIPDDATKPFPFPSTSYENEEPTTKIERYEAKYLSNMIEEKENANKHHIIDQFVAIAWGYKSFSNYTTEQYLQEMADFLLEDYNLTLQQKVNSVKVRHILSTFERIIFNHDYLLSAQQLSEEEPQLLLKNPEYKNELKMVDEFTLTEGEIAMDLLMQSFAPPNLSPFEYIKNELPISNGIEDRIIRRRRSAGVFLLVNSLLDPQHRLKFSLNETLSMSLRKLKMLLENQAIANFEVYNSPKPGSQPNIADYEYLI